MCGAALSACGSLFTDDEPELASGATTAAKTEQRWHCRGEDKQWRCADHPLPPAPGTPASLDNTLAPPPEPRTPILIAVDEAPTPAPAPDDPPAAAKSASWLAQTPADQVFAQLLAVRDPQNLRTLLARLEAQHEPGQGPSPSAGDDR